MSHLRPFRHERVPKHAQIILVKLAVEIKALVGGSNVGVGVRVDVHYVMSLWLII